MANYKIVTKGVSFNILDPDQNTLLEHAMKRKNFSAYIKRLIQNDLSEAYMTRVISTPEIEPEDNVDDSFMENLI